MKRAPVRVDDGEVTAARHAAVSVSRRSLLRASAAAAVAATLPGSPAAAQALHERQRTDRVALLADLHVAARPHRRLLGASLTPNLEACVNRVVRRPRPDAVVVAGDCSVDDGRAGDYAQLSRVLAPLESAGLQTHLIPGNHDDREQLAAAFPQRLTGGPLPGTPGGPGGRRLRLPRSDWYLLDSLRETDETPGELGHDQCGWLAARLDESPDRPAFLVVHHPPGSRRNPGGRGVGLDDGHHLLGLLADRPQAKALFHGHLHRMTRWSHRGLHVLGLPATSYVFRPLVFRGHVDIRVGLRHFSMERVALRPGARGDGKTLMLPMRDGKAKTS